MNRSVAGVVLAFLSGSAHAALVGPTPVAEPGILELLGMGAVAAIVVAIRKRKR